MAAIAALFRRALFGDSLQHLLPALVRSCAAQTGLKSAQGHGVPVQGAQRSTPATLDGSGSGSAAYATQAESRTPPRHRVPARLGIQGVQHIIAVASGKGGVGKSTTAVNLAVALAHRLGLRVGLLDADVYGPSIPRMMGLSGKPRVDEDECMIPLVNYGVACMSMGFLMEEDVAAVWRGPMVMSALDTFMRRVRWAPLDVLVIDMPPGTGDAQLSISQQLSLSGAVIVSTPQDITLLDARRSCTMFRKVDVPILGIVENMSWFICGSCGHESHPFGSGGAEKAAADMDMELLGKIPLNIAIRETADAGVPIVATQPVSSAAQAYVSVAERVWHKLQAKGAGQQAARHGPPRIEFE